MPQRNVTRRALLAGAAATGALSAFSTRVLSQAPPGEHITPALIEAAKKEGKVNFYTAMEINVAEQFSKLFEAKFPEIKVKVERSGSERVFSRIAQEYSSKIYNVDFANTTDAAHVYAWKNNGSLPALCAGRCRGALSRRLQGQGWHVHDRPHPVRGDRLQHRTGEERGRAEGISSICSSRNGRVSW